jgi:tRNA pseudouridine55 synthase
VNTADRHPPAPARRRWRAVDGIVLLDKPAGLSSNQALQRVRRALAAEKAGHAGTLDPMATGMLPLCFGQATKACGTLLGQRKAYRATVRLGCATDTGDAEGRVTAERPVPETSSVALAAVLASLRGPRLQVPPMYSAIKRDGRPLYELARRGEEVERAPRPILIEEIRGAAPHRDEIDVEVVCSKGTYVRVLGEEIAAALGTVGHLGALRREWVEPFAAESMITLERVEADCAAGIERPEWLLPVDAAFPGLPRVDLDDVQALQLRQGRTLPVPAGVGEAPVLRAYGPGGSFLGLVAAGPDGRIRVQRLFVAGAGSGPEASGP